MPDQQINIIDVPRVIARLIFDVVHRNVIISIRGHIVLTTSTLSEMKLPARMIYLYTEL